jgi:hypothetical protein
MENIIKLQNIESKLLEIRKQKVLLDIDIAALYEVETKRINEAVKNNPDKFPMGYIFELSKEELDSLKSKISTLKGRGRGQHSKYLPKAFTEKGLYMLATILKSKIATQTTISIIETFAKVRELTQTVKELSTNPKKEKKKSLMKNSGEIMADLLGDNLNTTDTETSFEINFAVMKFKHTIKRK